MPSWKIWLIGLFLFHGISSRCQSNVDSGLLKIDVQKWSAVTEKKLGKIEDRIIAGSKRTLNKLQKQETKLRRKLADIDSSGAESFFSNTKYQQLRNELNNKTS